MAKVRLETADPVSQTLLIPLWARAIEQREPEPIVRDPVAAEMVAQLDYDWERIRLSRGDLALCVVRLREFDRFVRDFLVRHPSATVVHLGCGLDARYQRVDDGQVAWFDLDLPDVIAVRRQLLPESDRDRYLAASVTERGWMDEVVCGPGSTVMFVAEAVLPYLEHAEVKELVLRIQRRFPGAELVTDVCTPFAVRTDNIHLRVTGSAARLHWAARDPQELESWSPGIRLVESFDYFDEVEPRTGFPAWMGRVPFLARSSTIQRYELGAISG
ncbi:MAG: class I SAM-dependent methyltransferase [Propionibacteriaceae bacterium]